MGVYWQLNGLGLLQRNQAKRRESELRQAELGEGQILSDIIAEVNPTAESFLNASARSVRGSPVFDVLAIDAPLDDQFKRVRQDQSSLFMNNVDVGTGQAAPINCNIQIAPMTGMPGFVLVLMEPRMIADRLGRSMSVKTAARSAIGMAEMLAHEIKDPLARFEQQFRGDVTLFRFLRGLQGGFRRRIVGACVLEIVIEEEVVEGS